MRDISGRSLPLPSMRFDRESLSWRTCEATSLWDLEMSSPSFPEWGMTQDGVLFELLTPERPTVAQGSSWLPPPTARDYKDTSIAAASHRPNDEDTLSRALHHLTPITLLKTPVATEKGKMDRPERYLNRNEPGARFDLSDQVAALSHTPTCSDANGAGPYGIGGPDLRTAVTLLPTPRAQNGEERNQNIWARPLDQPQNLENALALLPTPVADHSRGLAQPGSDYSSLPNVAISLLPTPTVMDMGSNYTPEEWEAWKLKQKEAHRNGNGHGASLTQEAIFLLPTPRAQEPGATTIGYGKNIIEAAIGRPQIDPSLTQEALSIGASTQGQFFDGSESSDDQPQIQLSPE